MCELKHGTSKQPVLYPFSTLSSVTYRSVLYKGQPITWCNHVFQMNKWFICTLILFPVQMFFTISIKDVRYSGTLSDITAVVDWALKINYLSIYLSTLRQLIDWLIDCSKSSRRQHQNNCNRNLSEKEDQSLGANFTLHERDVQMSGLRGMTWIERNRSLF